MRGMVVAACAAAAALAGASAKTNAAGDNAPLTTTPALMGASGPRLRHPSAVPARA